MSVLGASLKLARAHAEYERSEPAAGAVVPEPPTEVHVWFTQELFRREGGNILEVFGPDGAQVDKQDAHIDDNDRTHMIVSLREGLPAGTYTVRWQTLSADDGDTDRGEFTFTVGPAGAQVTPQSSPTPTLAPTVTLTSAPTSSSTSLPSPGTSPQTGNGLPCLSGVIFGGLILGLVVAPPWRKRGRG